MLKTTEGTFKMKITKRQLSRIIREEKTRILAEQFDSHAETVDAYDFLMDMVTDKLAPDRLGKPASRDKINAWVSALNSVAEELEQEMPSLDDDEFITLREPGR